MHKKTEKFIVKIEVPEGATPSMVAAYIRDAVSTWGGGYEPPNEENDFEGHPMFGCHNVTVRRIEDHA